MALLVPIVVAFALLAGPVKQAAAASSMCPSGYSWVNPATTPIPVNPTDPHTAFQTAPQLSKGSQDNASWGWVHWLQQSLNEAYHDQSDPFHNGPYNFHPPLAVDGSFGPNTLNAVLDYQIAHPPLSVDGQVGPHTWGSLGVCEGAG